MDNKCSWVRLVLFLAALTSMIDQSAVDGFGMRNLFGWRKTRVEKPRYELYPLIFLDKYSTRELNDMLGYSMPGGALNVASLLALSKDKDKKETILGKFSVNELLDWNNYYSKDCDPKGMVNYRKKCTKIGPKHIPLPDDSQLLGLVIEGKYRSVEPNAGPLEYLKYYNLHKYCTTILAKFEEQCQLDNFLSAKAKVNFDKKTLDKFSSDVNRHIEANEVAFQYDYKEVVIGVLAKTASSEVKKIESSCKNIVTKLGHFYEDGIKFRLARYHQFNLEYFKICEAILN